MNACSCTQELHAAPLDSPTTHRSTWRRLLDQLVAPSIRMHRYRMLSSIMLEDTLGKVDNKKCN